MKKIRILSLQIRILKRKNYLLRLGWSHGDKEIFSETEMIELFNLENIRKSSSRLDIEKLKNLNKNSKIFLY